MYGILYMYIILVSACCLCMHALCMCIVGDKGFYGHETDRGDSLTWHQLQSLSDSLTGQMLGSPHKRYGVVSTLLQTGQLCLTHSPSTNLSIVSCVASGVEDGVASGVSQWRGRSPGESD